MRINITSDDGAVFLLDVSENFSVGELKEILEVEFETPRGEMALVHNMMTMADNQPLSAYNMHDGDVVMMTRLQPTQQQPGGGGAVEGLPFIDWSSVRIPPDTGAGSSNVHTMQTAQPPADEKEEIRQYFLNTPHELAILKERNPPLAEALLSGDKEKFYKVLEEQQQQRKEKEAERIRMLNADPLDPRYQQKIAEDIRHINVQNNMESAIEHIPEMFGQVIMLYIKCSVNGCPVLAFVDSGAQSTIMSQECAERCNIMRLVDQRWAGTAVGVGTQEIVGRVHLCQIQIEDIFLPSSFSILKRQPMDMLLGLDMLKRHQCCIDLKNNVLHIGTSNTSTPFLAEKDIPKNQRMVRQASSFSSDTNELEDRQLAEALAKSEQPQSPRQPLVQSPRQPLAQSPQQPPMQQSPQNSMMQSSSSQFREEDVHRITSAGFTRQEAIAELTRTQGNVELALGSLLARSLKF